MKRMSEGKASIRLRGMQYRDRMISAIIFLLIVFLVLNFKMVPVTSWGNGSNYRNYSVRTTVNVTDAYPEILNVTCNSGSSITLTAGSTKEITCLVKILDFNGGNTITGVNMTFYYYLNASSDPEDNNTHYTNTSCYNLTVNGNYANWTCNFSIWYYANNGTWLANATVNDSRAFTDNYAANATISSLLALNVTSPIDFGNMAVGDTSVAAVQANITNFGNIPLNVTVFGFGGESDVTGASLAMICDQRNISIDNERYDLDSGTAYDAMTPISGVATTVPGIKILKQTIPGTYEINSTYWRLHVNATTNPFGICNGTVVFTAISP